MHAVTLLYVTLNTLYLTTKYYKKKASKIRKLPRSGHLEFVLAWREICLKAQYIVIAGIRRTRIC